jgi:glycosyltransferase involved in cell wall biosynthesis
MNRLSVEFPAPSSAIDPALDSATLKMRDRPLRFCMITTFYPPYNFGGDGISVHRLSNELARRGHQVEVIHSIDAHRVLARRQPVETYCDHHNVTVHGLKSPFGLLAPLASQQLGFPFLNVARIKRILEKRFDVIHYHNISLFGPKILEYGRGIKIYTMREYWLVCPTHTLFRFNSAACIRPHCFACSLIYKRPPQWWRYTGSLEAAVKHVDAFIAPSRFSKEIHLRKGLNVPIVHLPNFVPLAEAEPLTSEHAVFQPPEKPYFLFVGRLEKLKGLQTLIPIFRRYHKAELWIAGKGDYERRLRQLADGTVNIRFLGFLSDRQLQDLYRKAVAVIVPSICFEVFGLVIIEAFRQRTPVIVRNLGGMPETVQESGGGLIYDTDEELLAAMDQLLADSAYRRRLGLLGHTALEKKWTADAHLQRYFELIGEIAASRSRPVAQIAGHS